MTRKFKTADYEAALDQTVSLREALPANHLARFVVELVAELDLARIYERYRSGGGEAYAPESLLALLFYCYASGRPKPSGQAANHRVGRRRRLRPSRRTRTSTISRTLSHGS
jgi:transposase